MEYRGKHRTLEIAEELDYYKALNLGGELSHRQVEWLLKWKDRRWLSPDGDKAGRVLARIDEINAFRSDTTMEDFAELFPRGNGVYDVFVRHIARPAEYPIFDRHVFCAYCLIEKGQRPGRLRRDLYGEYRDFFFKAYESVFGTGRRSNDLATVRKMKMLDNALFDYGKAHEKA